MPTGGYQKLTPAQYLGSEYGGALYTTNSLQPKGEDAITAADELRLGYTVGDTSDPRQQNPWISLEDHRQMMGLRPASGDRPVWLPHTGKIPLAEIIGVEYPDGLQPEEDEL
jgi:hypothetical protein